ncbi:SDR family oxidoreductase [Membranihabitans maritimus]|uniref:SDR family oxidoreductase n=1 Tax=Membranihabitans maritimus TaxID=2904244 RepID=UPI001F3C1287|nr:SDR family oxidoreductase [Membranihabitans maritimus]
MDLNIGKQNFLILGASSGLGLAVAEKIQEEGGFTIVVARSEEKLNSFHLKHPNSKTIQADIMSEDGINFLLQEVENFPIHGILVNAGGPPAGNFLGSTIETWDKGYEMVFRWKAHLLLKILPSLIERNYGRITFIESVSIKKPIEGLVLSNAYRMAVVGLVKSIINEINGKDITLNIIGPGYHKTERLKNLIEKQAGSEKEKNEIEKTFANQTAVGRLGIPEDLASLAVWLLSPHSGYVTGQTILVDGGLYKGSL